MNWEKYGAGVYTISFEARSYNGNKNYGRGTTTLCKIRRVFSHRKKNPKKSVTVNGQWQRYEVTF